MLPLSKLTVLDLTVNTPGPYCSMILSDLGARVIKIEPPGGDPLRHSNHTMFAAMNRGKESIVLDLKTDIDRDLLCRLAVDSDIVLEGSRPGVAKRLGADYDTLSDVNPGIVYCSISGFGQNGPWKDRSGHDLNYLALSGYLSMQASIQGGRPWPPAVLISDLTSGLYAAISVLAAMTGRSTSETGAFIDLSMTDSVISLMGLEISGVAQDEVAKKPNVTFIPTYGVFACADGKWLSLGIVHEDHFWSRFCAVAGLVALADWDFEKRLAQPDQVLAALEERIATKVADEWERLLLDQDVPVAVVRDFAEIFDQSQFQFRGMFHEIDGNRFVAQPMKFSTASLAPSSGPPSIDEHREAIISSIDAS